MEAGATKIGRYEIIGELGRGGMGVVLLGHDPTLGRRVAIKVLADHFAQDRALVERFLSEARAIAALQHPNIVSIYEAGEDGGKPFFAMEYVEGRDLSALVQESGRLSLPQATEIVSQIAAALDFAHGKGIVHRDVKPANVLITNDGHVKVTDFGIAKVAGQTSHTAAGMLVGTPDYMAPELWQGKPAVPASDQYALAVVAFELLSGELPFSGDTPMTKGYSHVNNPIPHVAQAGMKTGMAPRLNATLAQGLAKQPEKRFQSTSEFAGRIADVVAPAPVAASKRPFLLAAALALAAIGLLAFSLLNSSRAVEPAAAQTDWAKVEAAGDAARAKLDGVTADALADKSYEEVYKDQHQALLANGELLSTARLTGESANNAQEQLRLRAKGFYLLGRDHYGLYWHKWQLSIRSADPNLRVQGSAIRKELLRLASSAAADFFLYLQTAPSGALRKVHIEEMELYSGGLGDVLGAKSVELKEFRAELEKRKKDVL
jgi:predicted Ser/Thr protein kinase